MGQRIVLVAAAVIVVAAALFLFTRSQRRPASAPVASAGGRAPGAIAAAPAPKPRPKRPDARVSPAPRPSAPAEEAPTTGTLRIDCDVPGAEVFIDRQFVGSSPATAAHLAPGSHHLNVSAPGWDGVSESITVTPGSQDVYVKLKEVRLDATIPVIHKHAFGSCRGDLVATPEGLRYETTDRHDAFAVPLGSLETFDVDYLKKTLTVKLRGSRRYEFTDPEGNADRLFVFHRDVQKAREKLQKIG
jgi:hypothetical protein